MSLERTKPKPPITRSPLLGKRVCVCVCVCVCVGESSLILEMARNPFWATLCAHRLNWFPPPSAVGVGKAEFGSMKKMDGDDAALEIAGKNGQDAKKAKRDMVQVLSLY